MDLESLFNLAYGIGERYCGHVWGALKGYILGTSPISLIGLLAFPIIVVILVGLGFAHDYLGAFERRSEGRWYRRILGWVYPKKVFLSRSILQDLKVSLGNLLLFGIIAFAPVPLLSATGTMMSTNAVLAEILGNVPSSSAPEAGFFTAFVFVLLMILSYDLGSWTAHYMMHRIPLLWEFHKVHHSATGLAGITNHRNHIVDEILYAGFGGLCMGITSTLFPLIARVSLGEAALFIPFIVLGIVLGPLGILFHSHLWVSLGRLEYIIQSPAMHAIHHSNDPRHYDRNFGSVFAVFDFLFGTHYKTTPTPPETLELGVTDTFDWNRASLWELNIMPFKRGWRRVVRQLRRILPAKGELSPDLAGGLRPKPAPISNEAPRLNPPHK